MLNGVPPDPTRWIAVTHGPRTLVIAKLSRVDVVAQAWLPAWDRLVVGDFRVATTDPSMGRLTGKGTAISTTKPRAKVVLYDGVRIDPLGFKSPAEYERASASTRAARAKKAARAALAKRTQDDRLTLAFRRIRTGTTNALSTLAGAITGLAQTAPTAADWERVIRNAHAAVEQAEVLLFDATVGFAEAKARVDWADPCAEPLAALGPMLYDLDERLRVILGAFDAFEYTEDVARLEQIAKAFAADLSVLPGPSIAAQLDTLRDAVDGGPQRLPVPTEPSPPPP